MCTCCGMCLYACMCVHVGVHTRVFAYICACVSAHVFCTCTRADLHACSFMCTCMRVVACVCTCLGLCPYLCWANHQKQGWWSSAETLESSLPQVTVEMAAVSCPREVLVIWGPQAVGDTASSLPSHQAHTCVFKPAVLSLTG